MVQFTGAQLGQAAAALYHRHQARHDPPWDDLEDADRLPWIADVVCVAIWLGSERRRVDRRVINIGGPGGVDRRLGERRRFS